MLQLDQKVSTVSLNSTTDGPADGGAPAFRADNLEDGDHQLYGKVGSLKDSGLIIVDHFEYVAPLFRRIVP